MGNNGRLCDCMRALAKLEMAETLKVEVVSEESLTEFKSEAKH